MSVEIPQFPELSFDEAHHIYRLNGLAIPSVTTLMKPLSDDFYRTVDPEVLDRAAKRGTAIHNAVRTTRSSALEDISPAYAGYFGRVHPVVGAEKAGASGNRVQGLPQDFAVRRYSRPDLHHQWPPDAGGL